MTGWWLVIKWSSIGVAGLYLVLQCAVILLAFRRSDSDFKRRCYAVLIAMCLAVLIANSIRDIFETVLARRIDIAIVGCSGVVAIAFLTRLLALKNGTLLRMRE